MSRYIDADALKQHKFVSWTKPEFFDEKSLEQQAYQLGWNNAIEAIMENEPTADVQSVIRGEWTELYEDNYKCSACGAWWTVHKGTPQDNGMNFCPNCGADMREGM